LELTLGVGELVAELGAPTDRSSHAGDRFFALHLDHPDFGRCL